MDQLIPGLAATVEAPRDRFHPQVFRTFQALIAGWAVCLGPRTASEVWRATGPAAERHHGTPYAVFHPAARERDDLGAVLATLILTRLAPGGAARVVVDDTLGHERGARVASGGIFLGAVLSSKKHETFRFGLDRVAPGIAVPIPMRPDRYYCPPVLRRLYRKEGQGGYRTRPRAAAAPARKLAEANPGRTFWPVGDGAYVSAAVLRGRPADRQAIGPLHWEAALYDRPAPPRPKQKGAPRKEGDRPPSPTAMIEDTAAYPAGVVTIDLPKRPRELRVQAIRDVLWYRGSKTEPVMAVPVRGPRASGGTGRWWRPIRRPRRRSSSRGTAGDGAWSGRPSAANGASGRTARGRGAGGARGGRTRWRGSSVR